MAELTPFQRWWINSWPHRARVHRHIPKFLKQSPEPFRGEVLEIGAGQGWTSRRILETFPQVELTATDVDASLTRTFKDLQRSYGRRLKVREANVLSLPFDRGAFDTVIAIDVIHHLKPFAVRKAMQEMLRVVRPGGLVGISDNTLFTPSNPSFRSLVEETLTQEDAEIVLVRGDKNFDMWIRKAYPVESRKL